MRNRSSLLILIIALAFISAFLAYEPRRLAPVREQLSKVLAAIPPHALNPLSPAIDSLAPATPAPAPGAPAAEPGTPARIVRVPAIRDAQNYGWVQLPYGTRVDLVEEQRDGFLIRYDESFIVIPRAAVEDGSVILRDKRRKSAS